MSSSKPSCLPIVADHVLLQFARRGDLKAAQFLYREVARRMLEQLQMIRLNPTRLLDAGCGAGDNFLLLRERYPHAIYQGLDACYSVLNYARQRYQKKDLLKWIHGLFKKPSPEVSFIQADLAQTGLPPESLDFVWSNLALHWHAQPHKVFAEWHRILKVEGLVIFSSLGPSTLQELRQALIHADLHTHTHSFVDMHDFGDLLLENGWADPVMNQEIITLTYQDPLKLLADVHALGGNPSPTRRAGLVSRQWQDKLCDALSAKRDKNNLIHLTMEVIYGHAWRGAARNVAPHVTHISVSSIKKGLS